MPITPDNNQCPTDQISKLNSPAALKNGRTARATAAMFGLLAKPSSDFQQNFDPTPLAAEEMDPRYRVIADIGAGMASTSAELAQTDICYVPIDPLYCDPLAESDLARESNRSIRMIQSSLSHPSTQQVVSPEYLAAHHSNSSHNPIAMYQVASQRFSQFYLNHADTYRCGALPDSIPVVPDCDVATVGNYLLFREHNATTVIASVEGLLAQCGEVRIHPVVDYHGKYSPALRPVMAHFSQGGDSQASLIHVSYHEFQSDETLVVRSGAVCSSASTSKSNTTATSSTLTTTALSSFGMGFLHGLLPENTLYALSVPNSYAPFAETATLAACQLFGVSVKNSVRAAKTMFLVASVLECVTKGEDLLSPFVAMSSACLGQVAGRLASELVDHAGTRLFNATRNLFFHEHKNAKTNASKKAESHRTPVR